MSWRTAGCGTGCRRVRATVDGTRAPLWLELHEPDDHETRAAEALTVTANEAALDAYSAGLDEGLARGRSESLPIAALLLAVWRARMAPAVVRTGLLVVDRRAMTVTVDGVPVVLAAGEWLLLDMVARTPGELVTWEAMLEQLWPGGMGHRPGPPRPIVSKDPRQPLRMLLIRLRAKLGTAGPLIETRPGVGYVLRAEEPTNKDVS